MPTILKTKNSVITTVTPTTLAQGELAVNITDKKMWVGNAATTPVQIVGTGSGGGGAAGSNTQVQFNSSGSLAGSANMVFDGTTITSAFSGPHNGTVGATTASTGAFTTLAYTGTLTGGTGVVNLGSGQFYKDASGNVLIGTTTSSGLSTGQLQIGTTSAADSAIQMLSSTTGTSGVYFGDSTSGTARYSGAVEYSNNGDSLRFYSSSAERMRIDSSGRVCINQTSSLFGAVLEVTGGAAGQAIGLHGRASDGVSNIAFGSNGGSTEYARIQADNTSNISFSTGSGGAERMRIDSSGNVGIGVQNPPVKLHIAKSGGCAFRIDDLSTNYWELRNDSNLIFDRGGSERMRIDSSGNLLVGTTNNDPKASSVSGVVLRPTNIEVSTSGTAGFFNLISGTGTILSFRVANSVVGTISYNGSLTLYNQTSDYRLKTVVEPVTNSGARIDAIEPIEYDWNNGAGRTKGFLAHKFAEVYPNSVSGEKDAVDAEGKPVYQAMQASSSEVMADLIAEIQSLRKRVAQLESK